MSHRGRSDRRPAESSLTIQNVSVSFPGASILEGISWRLPVGARAVVLGPNGCGKSTLLRTITGYGHFTSGTVDVLGCRLGETHLHQLRQRIGIVDPRLRHLVEPKITSRQLVATGFFAALTAFYDTPTPEQLQRADKLLEQVGLAGRGDQPFRTLSSGQQTRAWLARALVHQPELLVLDEPTAELDLLARETFLATLSRLLAATPGLTLVMVTHHLEELLPETSHVLLLSEGRISGVGDCESVLTDERLSAAFGCPVHVQQRAGRWSWNVSPQVWHQLLGGVTGNS